MADPNPQERALQEIDRVLAEKPEKDGHALSQAARCLSQFRDEMIGRHRAGGASEQDRARLARLNSIISVVMGAHFPLGNIPWGELEKARGWLADLVAET